MHHHLSTSSQRGPSCQSAFDKSIPLPFLQHLHRENPACLLDWATYKCLDIAPSAAQQDLEVARSHLETISLCQTSFQASILTFGLNNVVLHHVRRRAQVPNAQCITHAGTQAMTVCLNACLSNKSFHLQYPLLEYLPMLRLRCSVSLSLYDTAFPFPMHFLTHPRTLAGHLQSFKIGT